MSRLTVAVTGLHATDNPGPGVAVIRAIREAQPDVKIVGLTYEPLDPGNFMPEVADNVFLMPYPSQGREVFLERMSGILAKTKIDVVVPTLDSELPLYLKSQDQLGDLNVRTFLPDEELFNARSKSRLHEFSERFDISVPKGAAVTTVQGLLAACEKIGCPLFIKGQFYEAFLAHTPLEAEGHFQRMQLRWGLPVVVQQFIPGEEYDVAAVGDGKGGLIGAVPMRKMQLTDKGKAWGGVTIADQALSEFVAQIVEKFRWKGPCELEIMRSRETGEFFLIEINPRFPAWIYLSVGAKRNLPWSVVELAMGRNVEKMPPPDPGIMFLRHSYDQICCLRDYEALATHAELLR